MRGRRGLLGCWRRSARESSSDPGRVESGQGHIRGLLEVFQSTHSTPAGIDLTRGLVTGRVVQIIAFAMCRSADQDGHSVCGHVGMQHWDNIRQWDPESPTASRTRVHCDLSAVERGQPLSGYTCRESSVGVCCRESWPRLACVFHHYLHQHTLSTSAR